MDRLATRMDALARQEAYQYDPSGNLTQFTDRKSQQATFTYDNLNRRIGAQYADGSSTSFTYDALGRLASVTDSVSGMIQFSYDNLDRLIQEVTPQGAVSYNYDALGRRTSMTANGQQPVSYGYDSASRLTQVAQGGLTVGLGYDSAGRRTSLTYPNGTNTTYTYDFASRLTNITHNGPAGLIESVTYTYDAAGNRISVTRANDIPKPLPTAVQAAYDAANELTVIASGATQSLTYDQNGNLTNDGTTTYTWDARNRLRAISGPGVSASFVYDALGRRISKTINGGTTSYLYDGNDIAAEIGGSAVGVTYLRSLNIDEPFVRQSTSNEYYHSDALGSVLALTGQNGVSQTTYNYDAFGKTTIAGTSSNPFQYTGRENDGTGLYYYRARYYNPSLGRFLSEDWFPTTNRYPYVLSNPLRFKDPLGLLVLGAGAGGTLATPVIAGDVTIAGVVDSNGNYANIAYGGVSTGPQIAAVAGPSIVFAPFANIDDLSGQSFDIQLRLLVQLTISIPIETSVKDGKTVVDPQFGKTVFTLDFVPGLNIGLGFGIGSTSVSKTTNLAKVLSGRK